MGVLSSDTQCALEAILGPGVGGLSSSTVVRLKEISQTEFADWKERGLCDKENVSVWADGTYFHVRCEDARPCILVLVGALADGTKELLISGDKNAVNWHCVCLNTGNMRFSSSAIQGSLLPPKYVIMRSLGLRICVS